MNFTSLCFNKVLILGDLLAFVMFYRKILKLIFNKQTIQIFIHTVLIYGLRTDAFDIGRRERSPIDDIGLCL